VLNQQHVPTMSPEVATDLEATVNVSRSHRPAAYFGDVEAPCGVELNIARKSQRIATNRMRKPRLQHDQPIQHDREVVERILRIAHLNQNLKRVDEARRIRDSPVEINRVDRIVVGVRVRLAGETNSRIEGREFRRRGVVVAVD
jgi:hypothetical protein